MRTWSALVILRLGDLLFSWYLVGTNRAVELNPLVNLGWPLFLAVTCVLLLVVRRIPRAVLNIILAVQILALVHNIGLL